MSAAAVPQPEELDVVQHPSLGELKFPHSMPMDERNASIERLEAAASKQDLPGGTPRLKAAAANNPAVIGQTQPTQFEKDRDPKNHQGIMSSAMSTVGSILKPSAVNPYPGMDLEQKQAIAQGAVDDDTERKASGRSVAYRTVAAIGSPIADVKGMERNADIGNARGIIGNAAGSAAPVLAGEAIGRLAPKAIDIAGAEGNPGTVYKKYLDPVSHVPQEMPKTTPHIDRALTNKIEINYPEVADRIRQRNTTLGDLDVARQVANDASKAAYTARGLPTQISKGFKNAADQLRDTIYPKIEALQNLPEGSLSDLKRIQGSAIEMGKPPKWGHFPTRWPTVAAERLAIRPAFDAARNVQTRVIGAGLPEPQSIGLRSDLPSSAPTPAGIIKARAEAERPEFGGEQAIPTKAQARSPRPAIDVTPDSEPALFRPPAKPVMERQKTAQGIPVSTPKIPGNTSPMPAVPAEMIGPDNRGLALPRGAIRLPAIPVDEATHLNEAGSVVVRDPRTGRMRRQYVTSSR